MSKFQVILEKALTISKRWKRFLIVYIRWTQCCNLRMQFNPFHTTGLFLYRLKTLENLKFSDVFGGYRNRAVAWNGLKVVWTLNFSKYLTNISNNIALFQKK